MPSMPGAPLLDLTRFHARQIVAGQHIFKQFRYNFHFVLFEGSVRVGRRRIFPGRGH